MKRIHSWESSKRNICNCSIVIQVHSLETFLSSDRNFNMIIQTENKSLKKKKKKADLESFTGETQESALIYSDFKHFQMDAGRNILLKCSCLLVMWFFPCEKEQTLLNSKGADCFPAEITKFKSLRTVEIGSPRREHGTEFYFLRNQKKKTNLTLILTVL